jgi:aquaporin Z
MNRLRRHYPEYLIEAMGLGLFMIAAALFTTLFEYPASPLHQALTAPLLRRFLIGVGMGLTAIGIVYSPWGKQSGAHLNPAVTFTFFRLNKVHPWDAFYYVLFQCAGGLMGLWLAGQILGTVLAHPSINYLVTTPGSGGAGIAFLAELGISCGMMLMILFVSNRPDQGRYTGLFAGALIAIYITLEAPLSGMSMNPARTLASAFPAQHWTAIWVYFTAPPLGMLLAAEVYLRWQGRQAVHCAKLHHQNHQRCIFRCGYRPQRPMTGQQLLNDQLPSSEFY